MSHLINDWADKIRLLISPKVVSNPKAITDDDEVWINDRMNRLAATKETSSDIERILLEGMSEGEIRAFCLGVRAGKHASARLLVANLSDVVNNVVIAIDPYRKR